MSTRRSRRERKLEEALSFGVLVMSNIRDGNYSKDIVQTAMNVFIEAGKEALDWGSPEPPPAMRELERELRHEV